MVHRVRVSQRDAVFIISVAARLVEMHPSTLRKYEKCGLLEPCRQSGRLRLYSPEDIARLRQIKTLVEKQGVNLAGVELALDVAKLVRELRRVVDEQSDDNRLRRDVRSFCDRMLERLGTASLDDEAAEAAKSPGRLDPRLVDNPDGPGYEPSTPTGTACPPGRDPVASEEPDER